MKESINIWGIKEFEGDGVSCPIIPANLPWYKKAVFTVFRFGVCPLCITMSVAYSIHKLNVYKWVLARFSPKVRKEPNK